MILHCGDEKNLYYDAGLSTCGYGVTTAMTMKDPKRCEIKIKMQLEKKRVDRLSTIDNRPHFLFRDCWVLGVGSLGGVGQRGKVKGLWRREDP